MAPHALLEDLMTRFVLTLALLVLVSRFVCAEGGPRRTGPNRAGVWSETGIVQKLPKNDPKTGVISPVWKKTIFGGYSGPAVANGKVYVTERELARGEKEPDDPFDRKKIQSIERV